MPARPASAWREPPLVGAADVELSGALLELELLLGGCVEDGSPPSDETVDPGELEEGPPADVSVVVSEEGSLVISVEAFVVVPVEVSVGVTVGVSVEVSVDVSVGV